MEAVVQNSDGGEMMEDEQAMSLEALDAYFDQQQHPYLASTDLLVTGEAEVLMMALENNGNTTPDKDLRQRTHLHLLASLSNSSTQSDEGDWSSSDTLDDVPNYFFSDGAIAGAVSSCPIMVTEVAENRNSSQRPLNARWSSEGALPWLQASHDSVREEIPEPRIVFSHLLGLSPASGVYLILFHHSVIGSYVPDII